MNIPNIISDNWTIISVALLFLLFAKWFLIILISPFYAVYEHRFRLSRQGRKYLVLNLLAAPFYMLEQYLTYGGIERLIIFSISEIPSNHIRKCLYILFGVTIGKNVVFHFRTEIRNPYRLEIGDGCIIGDNAILDARSGLVLGKNVNLSSNVSIYSLQHDYRDPMFGCKEWGGVKIEDRVWLGCNVIVLPGVTIGEGAVCCAGSIVTKDVEPYSVVAGIPAKKINERPKSITYEFKGKACRFY